MSQELMLRAGVLNPCIGDWVGGDTAS